MIDANFRSKKLNIFSPAKPLIIETSLAIGRIWLISFRFIGRWMVGNWIRLNKSTRFISHNKLLKRYTTWIDFPPISVGMV